MQSTHEKATGGKHVLIIEDERVLLDILTKKFQQVGYEVTGARDGVTGLTLVRTMKPDLVLLDMLLPKMNGIQILEELHRDKILPDLPVLVISNSGQSIEIDQFKKFGVRDYLLKLNFDPDDVVDKAKTILRSEEEKIRAKDVSDVFESSHTTEKKSVSSSVKNRANILIVEDDMLLNGLLTKKFEQEMFSVFQATNVAQGRKVLESQPINLICLDIILPGVDGFTFLEELKSKDEYKNIPVLILSNLGQSEEIVRGKKLGVVGYIVKATTTPGEIVEKVESLLAKKHYY